MRTLKGKNDRHSLWKIFWLMYSCFIITLLYSSTAHTVLSLWLSLCSPYTDSALYHLTTDLIQWWDMISHHLPRISLMISKKVFAFCQKGFCLFTIFSVLGETLASTLSNTFSVKLPTRDFHIVAKQPVCLKHMAPNYSFPIFFAVNTVLSSAMHLDTHFSNVLILFVAVWIKSGGY